MISFELSLVLFVPLFCAAFTVLFLRTSKWGGAALSVLSAAFSLGMVLSVMFAPDSGAIFKSSHELFRLGDFGFDFGYLFDVYQTQTGEGGLSNTIDALISLIGHVRIAGVPAGEEPDTGEVNYDYLLSLLEMQGYQGHIGCSYTPRMKTTDGLKWMKKYV